MHVIKVGLMELAHDDARHTLSVKWSDELSVESPQFLQTVFALFATIQEQNIPNLVVDSGVPAGGILTEKIIDFFTHNIPHTPLRKIALLESPDYLWDNNLYQIIHLLITTYQLPIAVRLVKSHAAAREWFSPPLPEKLSKTKGD